ncbi:MAG: DUF2891 domain-containing protein [Burkholderiaceae bacterium]
MLDEVLASRFARVALANVVAEFPNKLDHLMNAAAEAERPSALHPVFYGSYDWHSAVHMHWTLVTLLARFPQLPEAAAIAARLDAHFTVEKVAVECAYLDRPGARAFERPYGWAWLLKLSAALHAAAPDHPRAARWRDCVQPLADAFVARFLDYLPRADFPSRAGMHGNSAFALMLALDYAEIAGASALRASIVAKALQWFGNDRDYPIAYESSSEDFLSSGLVEAALMRRVLAQESDARFISWWQAFVPSVERLAHWLTPVRVTDRSDPRIAHLDGLNLSRAWCWSMLLAAMSATTPEAMSGNARADIERAIDDHLAASLPHAAQGEYVGTHWLASFAVLALGR